MTESTDSGTLSLSEASSLVEDMIGDDDTTLDNDEAETEEAEEEVDQEQDEDEDSDEERQPTEKEFEVKVNGEVMKVTESELKAGYMKDAYFRQLTTEVQSEKRQVAEQAEQVVDAGNQVNQLIDYYQNALVSLFDVARPDVAQCYQQDPTGRLYAEQQQRFDAVLAEVQKHQGVKENVGNMTQEQAQQIQAMRQRQLEKDILIAIPEWGADQDIASKEAGEIGNYARSVGYTNEQLKNLSATDLRVLRSAAKWESNQAKKPEAVKKAQNLPPVKSGKKISNQSDRFKKTGSKNDAIAFISKLI
jgi:hypothetical protein